MLFKWWKILVLPLFMVFIFNSCLVTNQKFDKLMPGIWRGELYLDENNPLARNISKVGNDQDITFKNAFTEGVLPFNFEVTYQGDSMMIDYINGDNRVRAEETLWGFNRKSGKDTVRINFVAYDTYIRAEVEDGIMTGAWYNPRKNWRVPFRGLAGKNYRFNIVDEKPDYNISGKWDVVFHYESGKDTTMGQFLQKGNKLTGTFSSPTGDYGFLEGTVERDRMYLSEFTGGAAYLVSGKITGTGRMEGTFMSGLTGRATWEAVFNPDAVLPDASILTKAAGNEAVNFTFPDEKGNLVSLSDAKFNGKAKILAITGTWCPNCKDEARFLTEYLKNNQNDRLEVIALSFEAFDDTTKVRSLLTNYKKVLDLPYTVLWAGKPGPESSAKVPFISGIKAYPTMVFLDRNNQIVSVHTGFSGPATNEYEAFKKDFALQIEKLTKW